MWRDVDVARLSGSLVVGEWLRRRRGRGEDCGRRSGRAMRGMTLLVEVGEDETAVLFESREALRFVATVFNG
jgi:hypothetical protein